MSIHEPEFGVPGRVEYSSGDISLLRNRTLIQAKLLTWMRSSPELRQLRKKSSHTSLDIVHASYEPKVLMSEVGGLYAFSKVYMSRKMPCSMLAPPYDSERWHPDPVNAKGYKLSRAQVASSAFADHRMDSERPEKVKRRSRDSRELLHTMS